jgi:hypothetical protein
MAALANDLDPTFETLTVRTTAFFLVAWGQEQDGLAHFFASAMKVLPLMETAVVTLRQRVRENPLFFLPRRRREISK